MSQHLDGFIDPLFQVTRLDLLYQPDERVIGFLYLNDPFLTDQRIHRASQRVHEMNLPSRMQSWNLLPSLCELITAGGGTSKLIIGLRKQEPGRTYTKAAFEYLAKAAQLSKRWTASAVNRDGTATVSDTHRDFQVDLELRQPCLTPLRHDILSVVPC